MQKVCSTAGQKTAKFEKTLKSAPQNNFFFKGLHQYSMICT